MGDFVCSMLTFQGVKWFPNPKVESRNHQQCRWNPALQHDITRGIFPPICCCCCKQNGSKPNPRCNCCECDLHKCMFRLGSEKTLMKHVLYEYNWVGKKLLCMSCLSVLSMFPSLFFPKQTLDFSALTINMLIFIRFIDSEKKYQWKRVFWGRFSREKNHGV